jgi:hypothetical protein
MAESGKEIVEISEARKRQAETVKAKANELFKGKLLYVCNGMHSVY